MTKHAIQHQQRPGLIRTLSTILLYWLIGPLLAWFTVTFLMPLLFGFANKSDQYVAYVVWVEHVEAQASAWVSPQIGFDPDPLLAEAWPYKVARNVGNAVVPAGQKGLFISDQQDHSSRSTERINSQYVEQGYEPPAETSGEVGIFSKIGSYFHDRFFEVNRTWVAIFLCRLIYVVEIAGVAMIWIYCAWKIGSYLVRKKDEEGQPHLQHRYRWWVGVLKFLVEWLPTVMALPIPVPGLAIALVFIFPMPFCVALFRSHYITRI